MEKSKKPAKLSGTVIAILELLTFYKMSNCVRKSYTNLYQLDDVSYYWLMFTILTGIWEATFVANRLEIKGITRKLLNRKDHVWTSMYDISYVLPWKLSKIFYAEYGAYADREYYSTQDYWASLIESSHALLCGAFSLFAIIAQILDNKQLFLINGTISMSAQLMNSILYIGQYLIQIKDCHSVNHISKEFPAGILLSSRPFMYINIFWTVMPIIVLGSII
jgi:hypothetical protein